MVATPTSSTALNPADRGATPPQHGEGAALARDLSEFLIEFSIALHKHAIYPDGHPLLANAEERVTLRLRMLLEERRTLALGVARNQLVIEGVATDPDNALLRELAQRLHRHHLGAVKFSVGIERGELASLLRTLAGDPTRQGEPLGLGPPEVLYQWEHARLYPMTFQNLELLEQEDEAEAGVARAAQLWVGLARAALASDGGAASSSGSDDSADPIAVARAIDEHSREVAYDQVIVGYLLQIAQEVKGGGGAANVALQRRVSRLVRSLRPETLRQLLDMGGDRVQRHQFVLDATHGLAADAVLELVRAAAESSRQTISHSLVRMLSKLAQHAEQGSPAARAEADGALRDHVRQLVTGWSLDDPNPGAYNAMLERVAKTPARKATTEVIGCEPRRIIELSLEVGLLGEPTERAIDTMLHDGTGPALLELLDRAGPDASAVVAAIWDRLCAPDRVRELLTSGAPPVLLERIVARSGFAAVEPLLDALEQAEEGEPRKRLVDQLAVLGEEIGPLAARRIDGAPAQVQRNLLELLSRLPAPPPQFDPLPLTNHQDSRVRREAIKLMLRFPKLRERGICAGVMDGDERIVLLALNAASESCPYAAVPLIMARVEQGALAAELRALAVRVVSPVRLPNTVSFLLRLVDGGRSLFGRRKLAPKSPEMLAALGGLATHWVNDADAEALLRVAAANGDPEIRGAIVGGRR